MPHHHTTAAPPTRILSRYLRKVLQGTECEGLGGVLYGGEGEGWVVGSGRREREREEEIIWALHQQFGPLLLLLLPIMEPCGPREAPPCLAAMQPLYHSNLLIVGAQLAHGGFLFEPPNIN